eukprot:COSAG01_NODE_22218_length_866_cov_1.178618_1_plen_67_part_10
MRRLSDIISICRLLCAQQGGALTSGTRSISPEIYLRHACSCHQLEDRNGGPHAVCVQAFQRGGSGVK